VSTRDGRRPTKRASAAAPRLLVLDTSYTLEMIRERGLEDSVLCRDLDGFFDHVWTVHPFSTLLTSDAWGSRYGRSATHELNARHSFIEGKVGRYRVLRRLFPLNFLISQIALFIKLLRLISAEKISVIRVGDPLYLGLFGWALSRVSGAPFVVRVGGNHDKVFETTGRGLQPRLMPNRKVEKCVERFVFKRADLVAGANQDNLDFALANGARPERSTLFRYGNLLDKRHFVEPAQRPSAAQALEQLGLEPKKFLLYIGRLEAVKHADDVVRVLAEVRARGHDVKAVLAGDGQMRPALVELARGMGVEDHVILAGNRDQDWLATVIPSAAAIVSPHTGRALLEAALGAVPIAAYDVDWQGELVETGVTGELVPHLAIRHLAESVTRFLSDPAYAQAMGSAARRRSLEMHNPASLDAHERTEYAKLLRRHRPGRHPERGAEALQRP
jgi:glycosyltransferase involved in cell wall biosynthesis